MAPIDYAGIRVHLSPAAGSGPHVRPALFPLPNAGHLIDQRDPAVLTG
jgi:hypothetical protein